MKPQRLLALAAIVFLAACSGDYESPTAAPQEATVADAAIQNPLFNILFSSTNVSFSTPNENEIPKETQSITMWSQYAGFATLGPPRIIGVEGVVGGPVDWLTGGVELNSAFQATLNLRIVKGKPLGTYRAKITLILVPVVKYVVYVNFVSGVYYLDCADSGDGWTFTGLWNVTAGGNTMNPRGATPLAEDGTNYFWYGSPSTGDFDFGTNSGTATGPFFSLPATAMNAVVRLRTWFEIEYDVSPFSFDFMEVWLINPDEDLFLGRINGSPYFAGNGTSFVLPNPWTDFEVPIPPSAYGYDWQLQLLFRTNDPLYNDYRGWGVDCMSIIEGLPPSSASAAATAGVDPSLLTGNGDWLTPANRLPVVTRR